MWYRSWIPIAAILVWPFVVWIVHRFQQAKIEARRDVQLALLAKFSSGEELSRFLATADGRRLMDHLASPGTADTREKIVGMLVGGSITTMLGIGFSIAAGLTGKEFLLIPALINGAIGLGLFIGAALAHRFWTKKELTQEQS
jgi:hypothetical protein